jgi:hypothetical protein
LPALVVSFSWVFRLKAKVVEKDKTRINTELLPVSVRVSFGPPKAEDEISA